LHVGWDNQTVTLSREIKEKAAEIGFDRIGIVPAGALVDEGEKLDAWLGNGYHGEMAWLAREPEKRSDPRLFFPAVRSVVVVLLNYFTPHKHDVDPKTGKISRYAWGDDYHDVMREKLEELLEWIETESPGTTGKICVDTAPMMDKAWAARAGLGWIGKSSNLITTEIGSWVFIGELLLDIELDYDIAQTDDHCGTCTACLDACPTNAIVEPYVVDSRKCISYATIELRDEELPAGIRNDLEGWIYGCDICQDVCPWNRFEKPSTESRFEPRLGETSLDLNDVAAVTHEEYVERFRRSAMKRTKLSGLKRNAAALLDNKR
jgi:epoxyqueuosine reductase